MQITEIRPQKKNPKRVNVYCDGKFALALDLETLVVEGLEVGQEITENDLNHLRELSGQQKLWEKALKFLSFRPRSEKETRDYLAKKKFDEKEIEWVVEKLRDQGYLNDEEFTRWWVEQRQTFRPKGWRIIAQELRQKGVAKEIVEGVRNLESGISELETARRVVEKKLKTLGHLPPPELKQKLTSNLARRGFDWEVIKKAIDEVLKKE